MTYVYISFTKCMYVSITTIYAFSSLKYTFD